MYGAYATVINLTLYVCGGWCPKESSNIYNVYKYESDKDQWSVLPRLEQYYGIPVNINDQITIVGGKHTTTKKPTNLVVTFCDKKWNDIYPDLSVARVEPAVLPCHHCVIVAGGKSDNNALLDSIEVLDIAKSHWVLVSTHLPQPMYNISATMCDDSFTIVGYCYKGGGRSRNAFTIHIDEIVSQEESVSSSVDENSSKWHKLSDAPYWFTVVVPNTSPPILIGGSDEQRNTVNDVTLYDNASNNWKKISSLPISCAFTTVGVINQSILVMGGASDAKTSKSYDASVLTDVHAGQLVLCK